MSVDNIVVHRLCTTAYNLPESAVSRIECIPSRWMQWKQEAGGLLNSLRQRNAQQSEYSYSLSLPLSSFFSLRVNNSPLYSGPQRATFHLTDSLTNLRSFLSSAKMTRYIYFSSRVLHFRYADFLIIGIFILIIIKFFY